MDEIGIENLLNVFSLMPDLEKEKKATFKPATLSEEKDPDMIKLEAEMAEAELLGADLNKETPEDSTEKKYEKFLALKKEKLSAKSKISHRDTHRKMFNDSFVNLLKHQVNEKTIK